VQAIWGGLKFPSHGVYSSKANKEAIAILDKARKSGTIAEVKRFHRSCGNYSHRFYEVYHRKISAMAQYY
jgi:hypothetical protein